VTSQTEVPPNAPDPEPPARATTPAREPDRHERGTHGDRRPRSFGERERPGREHSRRERDGRGSERDGRSNDRPPPPAVVAAGKSTKSDDGREFREVWSEEVGRTPVANPEAENGAISVPPSPANEPAAVQVASGQVRLYVNLGRKDGATPEIVAEILSSSGAVVPVADVELMNTHSYVNVAKQTAETLCAGLNGRSHNGRAVVCEPARPPKRRY
jgi:hypothetical protein